MFINRIPQYNSARLKLNVDRDGIGSDQEQIEINTISYSIVTTVDQMEPGEVRVEVSR